MGKGNIPLGAYPDTMRYLLSVKTDDGNEVFEFGSKHDRAVALDKMVRAGLKDWAFSEVKQ